MDGVLHKEPIGLRLIPGYEISEHCLMAKDFGGPQVRKRPYVIGTIDLASYENCHQLAWNFVEKFMTAHTRTSTQQIRDYVCESIPISEMQFPNASKEFLKWRPVIGCCPVYDYSSFTNLAK